MNREVYLTPEGKLKLEEELEGLIKLRPELGRELELISAEGVSFEDLDPAYEAVKNEVSMLESRILQIQDVLSRGRIITSSSTEDVVTIGSRIRLQIGDNEDEEYLLVGSAEANPREGRISNESPVGRAILGHKPGEEVSVRTPDGNLRIRILARG
jgi:transcription elongation factor GreA